MTTITAVIEVHVLNNFCSHQRGFDEIDEAVEYCTFLKTKGFNFEIHDPELELTFDEDEQPRYPEKLLMVRV